MIESIWPNMNLPCKSALYAPDYQEIYKVKANEGLPVNTPSASRHSPADSRFPMAITYEVSNYNYSAFVFQALLDERINITNLKALQLRNEFLMVFPYTFKHLFSGISGNKRSSPCKNEFLRKKRRNENENDDLWVNTKNLSWSSCELSGTDVSKNVSLNPGIFNKNINQSVIDFIDEGKVEKIKKLRTRIINRYDRPGQAKPTVNKTASINKNCFGI